MVWHIEMVGTMKMMKMKRVMRVEDLWSGLVFITWNLCQGKKKIR